MEPITISPAVGAGLDAFCCLIYLIPVLSLGLLVLWIVSLVDVLQRSDLEFPSRQQGTNERLIWILVIVLMNGLGALLYYFIIMRRYPRTRL